jgi:hypothetical protein
MWILSTIRMLGILLLLCTSLTSGVGRADGEIPTHGQFEVALWPKDTLWLIAIRSMKEPGDEEVVAVSLALTGNLFLQNFPPQFTKIKMAVALGDRRYVVVSGKRSEFARIGLSLPDDGPNARWLLSAKNSIKSMMKVVKPNDLPFNHLARASDGTPCGSVTPAPSVTQLAAMVACLEQQANSPEPISAASPRERPQTPQHQVRAFAKTTGLSLHQAEALMDTLGSSYKLGASDIDEYGALFARLAQAAKVRPAKLKQIAELGAGIADAANGNVPSTFATKILEVGAGLAKIQFDPSKLFGPMKEIAAESDKGREKANGFAAMWGMTPEGVRKLVLESPDEFISRIVADIRAAQSR